MWRGHSCPRDLTREVPLQVDCSVLTERLGLLSKKNGIALILGVAAGLCLLMLRLPPIPQWPSYHNFADHRAWLGIPNFGNVASNLLFAVVGVWGLAFLLRLKPQNAALHFVDRRERWPYALAFFGMLLTAFGSAYYHLAPNNARLVWDDDHRVRVPGSGGHCGAHQRPCRIASASLSDRDRRGQRAAVVRRRVARPRRFALLPGGAGVFDHRSAAGTDAAAEVSARIGLCGCGGILYIGENSGTRRSADFCHWPHRQRTYAEASGCGRSRVLDLANAAKKKAFSVLKLTR